MWATSFSKFYHFRKTKKQKKIEKSKSSKQYRKGIFLQRLKSSWLFLNSLSANPTKWSSTLKQFVGNSRRIVWVCLTILWGWRLKGYSIPGWFTAILFRFSCITIMASTSFLKFHSAVIFWIRKPNWETNCNQTCLFISDDHFYEYISLHRL